VESNFNGISNALSQKNITFNCGCKDPSAYAYVFLGRPYEINLCNLFWSAPQSPELGTDSQAGTIVHEISHFTNVAGTDDHAYG